MSEATKTVWVHGIRIVPFTGGLMAIYAFFWPESYGAWLGGIIHAFRAAAGL